MTASSGDAGGRELGAQAQQVEGPREAVRQRVEGRSSPQRLQLTRGHHSHSWQGRELGAVEHAPVTERVPS